MDDDHKKKIVSDFIAITQATSTDTKILLEKNQYNLPNSIDDYYEQMKETEKERNKIKIEPEMEIKSKKNSGNDEVNKQIEVNKPIENSKDLTSNLTKKNSSAYFQPIFPSNNEIIKNNKECEIRKPDTNPFSNSSIYQLNKNSPEIRIPLAGVDGSLGENIKNVQSSFTPDSNYFKNNVSSNYHKSFNNANFNQSEENKRDIITPKSLPENKSHGYNFNLAEKNDDMKSQFSNIGQREDYFRNPFISLDQERENSRISNNESREMKFNNFNRKNSFHSHSSTLLDLNGSQFDSLKKLDEPNKDKKKDFSSEKKGLLKKCKRRFSANIFEIQQKFFSLSDKKEIHDPKNLFLIYDDLTISQLECKHFFTQSKQRAFLLLIIEIKIFAIDGRRCVLLNFQRRQEHFLKDDFIIKNQIPEFYGSDNYNHIKNYMSKFEHLHVPIIKRKYAIKKKNNFISKTSLQKECDKVEGKKLLEKK